MPKTMRKPAIKVENLSKRYRLGMGRPGYRTFRETLVDSVKGSYNQVSRILQRAKPAFRTRDKTELPADASLSLSRRDYIWALKDVSFEVQQGAVIGIIGSNGAGKSTLLKILSKITEPTEGRVELRGRVGSLLEIGTGFHPELTGHENIYLYGAILGMDRWEVTRKFDEIVAFAELERFIDTPVKRYSSGMYMRLAFSVAAHLEPEILLVDEVLAVGDIKFQKKCLGKMGDVAMEGRTVLFVSHNMGAIRSLCDSAFLLEAGSIRLSGEVRDVVEAYETREISNIESEWNNTTDNDSGAIAFLDTVRILDEQMLPKSLFLSNESIYIELKLTVREEQPDIKAGFDLTRNGSVVFRSQQVDSPKKLPPLPCGVHRLICEIPADLLSMGEYCVTPLLSIHLIEGLTRQKTPVVKFKVVLDTSRSDFHIVLNERNHPGPIFPLLSWKLR